MIEMLLALCEGVLKEEDKFILSKAHASFPFCLLLREKGYDPSLTTRFEIDPRNDMHCTTGSLGHGLPIGTGMALARKLRNVSGKIYVMMSDGECQEGTTWESLLIAARHKLDNLVVLVDYNKIQAITTLDEARPLDDLSAKFKAFNWGCVEVKDGHSFDELIPAHFKNKTMKRSPGLLLFTRRKGKVSKHLRTIRYGMPEKLKGKILKSGKKSWASHEAAVRKNHHGTRQQG